MCITTADLRHPVVFMRKQSNPASSAGFNMVVRPYYNAFAHVKYGKLREFDGESSDLKQEVVFTIRYHPAFTPEIRDIVKHEGAYYRLAYLSRYHSPVGKTRGSDLVFWRVHTFFEGSWKDTEISVEENLQLPKDPDYTGIFMAP